MRLSPAARDVLLRFAARVASRRPVHLDTGEARDVGAACDEALAIDDDARSQIVASQDVANSCDIQIVNQTPFTPAVPLVPFGGGSTKLGLLPFTQSKVDAAKAAWTRYRKEGSEEASKRWIVAAQDLDEREKIELNEWMLSEP